MEGFVQDVRYGIRQLFRQRGSSLVAILTLALGIGLSTAIFSVIDATMLRPLPYPAPEQLVDVFVEETRTDGTTSRPTTSMEDMREWQKADDVLAAVAAWGTSFRGRIAEGPEPERLQVLNFTEHYLSMHGAAPVLGRDFTREDTDPGSPLVALLGYGYWQRRYGGRSDVIGQTIRLDADVATIVGVLPAWFSPRTSVANPLRVAVADYARRGSGRVNVYARLQPGVTMDAATARLSSITPQGSRTGVREARASLRSRLAAATTSYRTTVWVLTGAVALTLLIAVVNVAGLLLARGAARQSELGVRASLGAGRGRLVRQLLTESVVLAIPAAALGLLLAWMSLDLIVANIPLALPSDSPVTINGTVLAGTLLLLLPTALLFGFVPAIRLSRVRIGSVLARGGRQVGSTLSHRGGQILIGAEIALAVVLVAGAGLMLRSFMRISAVDLGFDPEDVITMQVLPLDREPAAHKQYYWQLVQQVRAVPGVTAAGVVDNFALGGGTSFTGALAENRDVGIALFEAVPGYFEAIRATLRAGRFPSDAEYSSGFEAAVISESAAKRLFPEGSAIGREFWLAGYKDTPRTVVGVIADLRHGGPIPQVQMDLQPQVYLPLNPTEHDLNQAMTVVVRQSGDVPGLADQLRRVALGIGPRVLVERIRSANDLFGDRVITPRRRTVLLGLLGGAGLLLALVGVFGMTAYAVARRTAEIGVRMAFGARPPQVVRMVVREAALPVVIGTLVGVGGALLATRVIETFLFQTAPRDPLTLAVVSLVLAATGCIAALVPAIRAARVDPVTCLRTE